MGLHLIADELGRLENPSLVDDLLYSAALGSLRAWAAVILTAVVTALAAATVGVLLYKLQISGFRRRKTLIRRLPSFYSSGSDDDEASISSSDGEEEGEGERDEMEVGEEEEEEEGFEDFRRGKVNEMGNFSSSLADLMGGMGVVKACDGLGLGFDRSGGAVSFFDVSRGEILRSFNGGAAETTVLQLASPTEIVSAADEAGGAVVRVWDARAGDESPAAAARSLLRRRVAGVLAREGKVFVGDEGGEVAALDLRNLVQVESGAGFGSWWRSAARCLTLLSPRLENA